MWFIVKWQTFRVSWLNLYVYVFGIIVWSIHLITGEQLDYQKVSSATRSRSPITMHLFLILSITLPLLPMMQMTFCQRDLVAGLAVADSLKVNSSSPSPSLLCCCWLCCCSSSSRKIIIYNNVEPLCHCIVKCAGLNFGGDGGGANRW